MGGPNTYLPKGPGTHTIEVPSHSWGCCPSWWVRRGRWLDPVLGETQKLQPQQEMKKDFDQMSSKPMLEVLAPCASCCWVLTAPSGEQVRRCNISGPDTRNQVKGKQQTRLFSNGENLIYPSLVRHDQDHWHWFPKWLHQFEIPPLENIGSPFLHFSHTFVIGLAHSGGDKMKLQTWFYSRPFISKGGECFWDIS